MSRDLRDAAELLRRDLGEGRSAARHAVLRARFVEAATRQNQGRTRRWAGPLLAVATMAIIVVSVWFQNRTTTGQLAFVAGPDARPGQVGTYYAASDEPFVLHFDDGSRVVLGSGSGLRVQKATPPEALFLVERGVVEFDVEHEPKRIWRIAAGPYVVRVTGTRFSLDWASQAASLIVQMQQGSVTVSGPGLDGDVAVSGTERLVVGGKRDPSPATPEAPALATEQPVAAPAEPASPAANMPGPGTPSKPRTIERQAAPAVRWSVRVTRGEHDTVLADAEAQGIDVVLGTAGASDLRALADAARFRGRTALSRRALSTLRSRFPGSTEATAAAFVLGRLEDAAGHVSAALEWYEAYLAEGGPLAPEARGRAMIALYQLGRTDEARTRARDYLEAYPDGAYRDHARDIAR